jgi:hypothetical protein
VSADLSAILGPGFRDAFKRATALPGEPHWDEDCSIPCERLPADVIGWNDPIPDEVNP